MEKKKLMSVSLLFLSFCIEWQVCSCVRPGTSSRDKEKHEEPQSLQGASTSGQCATSPPFNNTSLEERPEGQPMGQIVQIDENQLTHQGNSVEEDQRTLGRGFSGNLMTLYKQLYITSFRSFIGDRSAMALVCGPLLSSSTMERKCIPGASSRPQGFHGSSLLCLVFLQGPHQPLIAPVPRLINYWRRDELSAAESREASLRFDRYFCRPDFVAGIHPLHWLYGAQSHVLSSPKRDRMVREERVTEREQQGESERVGEIERQESDTRPPRQGGVSTESLWLCEHYQRRCSVQFPCCTQFYPCHRCHNSSANCEEAKASVDATHFKCSLCQCEQEIDENSDVCRGCRKKMAAYFCAICKQFTGVDKNPYHCDQCGICRIYKDKAYHCKVCNVCLDKRLEGNHGECREDAGRDQCFICLVVVFSRPYLLPCSHAVHRECLDALRESGGHTCPVCRHPLPTPSNEPSGRDHQFFLEVPSLLLLLVRLAFVQCG